MLQIDEQLLRSYALQARLVARDAQRRAQTGADFGPGRLVDLALAERALDGDAELHDVVCIQMRRDSGLPSGAITICPSDRR